MSDHVEVTGHGAHLLVPDLVTLRARVQCDAEDVATALDRAASRSTAALQAAADHGVEAPDRRTEDVGIHARHDREGRAVVGYTAYQAVQLTVRDASRVGDLLRALAGAAGDALTVDGIEMTAQPGPGALEAAREAAFEDARARAVQYATLAGATLGRVVSVHEGTPDDHRPRPMTARSPEPVAMSMPVEGGTRAVTTSVTVRWALT